MKGSLFLVLAALFLNGCAGSLTENVLTVENDYETVVFTDGISPEEAKIIAQKRMIKDNVADLYWIALPKVAGDVTELPNHDKYWFIYFEEKEAASSIPFIFMVLVDKETGKVKFADDYNEGNTWILEAALLH